MILLVIFEILLVILINFSDIINTSLSHLYGLFSHSYRLHRLELLAVFVYFIQLLLGFDQLFCVCLFGEDNGDACTSNKQTMCPGSSA
jgi:hypothetical protein